MIIIIYILRGSRQPIGDRHEKKKMIKSVSNKTLYSSYVRRFAKSMHVKVYSSTKAMQVCRYRATSLLPLSSRVPHDRLHSYLHTKADTRPLTRKPSCCIHYQTYPSKLSRIKAIKARLACARRERRRRRCTFARLFLEKYTPNRPNVSKDKEARFCHAYALKEKKNCHRCIVHAVEKASTDD